MEEGEEKGRGFKVEDRRRFSPEGELKPEHRGEEAKSGEPERSEQRVEPERSASDAGEPRKSDAAREAVSGAESGGHPHHHASDITFASFMVGLSTEALAFLGEMPNPETGQADPNLVAAQQIIDIIGILREKTRGNLSPDEEGLIDAILFDLRMKYVEKARVPVR